MSDVFAALTKTWDSQLDEIGKDQSRQPATIGLIEKLSMTWPARMAQAAFSAMKLPGDVYAGRVTPNDPEYYERAADLAGTVTGGSFAAAPAVRGGVGMGIKAYHGSPHDFDRFDMSKIGTGEGAQAYGHGLYFAENPRVAQQYRDDLSKRVLTPQTWADDILKHHGGDKAAALADLDVRVKTDPSWRAVRDLIATDAPIGGRMYEVEINAKPEQFLDWDAGGKQKYRDLALSPENPAGGMANMPQFANEQLKQQGYAGIKYLDQGSRGSGQGSSNYVLFRDDIVKIIRKYGIAGAAAVTGMSQADIREAAAEGQ